MKFPTEISASDEKVFYEKIQQVMTKGVKAHNALESVPSHGNITPEESVALAEGDRWLEPLKLLLKNKRHPQEFADLLDARWEVLMQKPQYHGHMTVLFDAVGFALCAVLNTVKMKEYQKQKVKEASGQQPGNQWKDKSAVFQSTATATTPSSVSTGNVKWCELKIHEQTRKQNRTFN